MNLDETLDVYANAKTAIRFFSEHQLWQDYIEYENTVITHLEREGASGNLSDSAYAIKKAYMQGRVEGLRLLQEGRKQLLKQGEINGNADRRQTKYGKSKTRLKTIGRFDEFEVRD